MISVTAIETHSGAGSGKHAVRAASLAFFVDAFDAYVPVLALTPAMAYFVPPSLPEATRATISFVAFFTISWVGRPIGAFILGHFADTIGRRKTTLISLLGFALATLLIALLPGYAKWGITSVAVLAALRLIGGIFIGGEYTGAAPLALEYAPRAKRGIWGSLCNIGYPSALAANTLIVFLLLHFIEHGTQTSPYSTWGWRIPFAIGVILALIIFVYYYRSVPESKLWLGVTKAKAPIKVLLGEWSHLKVFLKVCILMFGAWLTLNAVAGSMPTVFREILHINSSYATLVYFLSTAIGAALFPLVGLLGQKVGRKQLLMLIGVISAVVLPLLYAWLIAGAYRSSALLLLLTICIQVPTLAVWALVTAYITESFPTHIRSSGYGLGFSLTTVPAAFYAFGMLGLGHVMPYRYTVCIILALGGVCLLAGAWVGADNRSVLFHDQDSR